MDIITADILDWTATYSGPKFHAMFTDPPYELGFMGKRWDASGIAFRPETWTALAEHLLPGAFIMAFASSRGWHRMGCAMEDAGLVAHPSIFFLWVQGQGFPKATRIPDERFAGHRYGLQSLKPSVEPVLCFQKSYAGKPVDSIASTGAGALNIDGARIGTDDTLSAGEFVGKSKLEPGRGWNKNAVVNEYTQSSSGRWPANLCLDESAAAALDAQAGILHSQDPATRSSKKQHGWFANERPSASNEYDDTGGPSRFFFIAQADTLETANPFYYCAKASRRERDAGLEEMPLQTKRILNGGIPSAVNSDPRGMSGGGDRQAHNPHPTVKPISLIRWLATLLLPPVEYAPRRILIPFSGSGSECIGAALAGWEEVTGIEREVEYAELSRMRIRHWTMQPALLTEGV